MWLYIDKTKPFTAIVAGFAIHSLAMLFRNVTGSDILYAIICLYGWYFIISGFYRIRSSLKVPVNNGYWKLVECYVLVCFIMIIRGYNIDYPYLWRNWLGAINFHFFYPYYILPFFMPIIALIPLREIDFSCLVRWSMIFSVITVFALVFYGREMLSLSLLQAIGYNTGEESEAYRYYGQIYTNVVIVAFCYRYVAKKVWRWNTIGLFCALIINLICGRRGTSAALALMLCVDAYFYIKSFQGIKKTYRRAIVLTGLCLLAISFLYGASFAYIKHRGMEDNRTEIDNALMAQMSPVEKWIGKGLNGRYYFNLHQKNDYLKGWRYLSETGYYYLILRGGYILTWVYILVIFIPAIKGIFRSNNILCKGLGAIMIISLLQLYPFGHLAFNLYFFVIWTGVRLCSSRDVRDASDDEIRQQFFPLKE